MRFIRLPGGFGTGVLIGLGAATLIPLTARMLAGAGKPLLKEAVKGGVMVMDRGKALYEETRSSISEAGAEAKAEVSEAQTQAQAKETGKKAASSTSKSESKSE